MIIIKKIKIIIANLKTLIFDIVNLNLIIYINEKYFFDFDNIARCNNCS